MKKVKSTGPVRRKKNTGSFEATICLPVTETSVLLAKKIKGVVGVGLWNGYGGRMDPGEAPQVCALRELQEESGLVTALDALKKVAIITFHNRTAKGMNFDCIVHVFIVKQWKNEPIETDEMIQPTWFQNNALPFDEMLPADRIWLPFVLEGKTLKAEAWYDPGQKTLEREMSIEYIDAGWLEDTDV